MGEARRRGFCSGILASTLFAALPRTSAVLALVIFAVASPSWASITSCASGPLGNDLSAYAPAALGNGCSSVNVSFENLTLTQGTVSGIGSAQTTANNAIYATGTGPVGDTIGPVRAFFDGTDDANWVLNGVGTGSTSATIGYTAIAHTGGAFGAAPASAAAWAFKGLVLNPNANVSSGPGNFIIITMNFCLNATSTTAGSGGCVSANQGTISASYFGTSPVTFSCVSNSGGCVASNSNTINFGPGVRPTEIAISDTYTLTKTGSAAATLTITNFENQFLEGVIAPEPSTFVLLSFGLVGLGFLRYRRNLSRS